MAEQEPIIIKRYDIRLVTLNGAYRIFATAACSEDEAVTYTQSLLSRHEDCKRAELWCGRKMLRQF